jgi:hypothetical protein
MCHTTKIKAEKKEREKAAGGVAILLGESRE